MRKAFVFRLGLSLVFVLLCFIKGRQGFFIKHSVSGLCLKVEDRYFAGNLRDWGANYFVKFYDGCLHSHAQFRYVDDTFVHNIEKVGTFFGRRFKPGKTDRYFNRFIVYRNTTDGTFVRTRDFALRHKSGALEIYDGTYCATPSITSGNFDGAYPDKTTTCNQDLQKFTFGSVTDKDAIMTDVNCASSQVMEVVKAEYGVFSNGETFDENTDAACSLPVGCIVKGLCDGKISCGIAVDSTFTFSRCTASKRLHMEYRCVDNLGTPITSVSDVRLTDGPKPSEGVIEVLDGATWRKVHDEDWNKRKQAGLCRHLGYIDESDLTTYNIGSETVIASGYLYCDGVASSDISCCAYLYTSKFPAGSGIPYARCKICDDPLLLESSASFPDSVFSASDGNAYEARLTNNGWCWTNAGSPWLQIDLQKDYYISHIATFGDKVQTKWVTSYVLQYSRTASGLGKTSARRRMIQANHDAYRASITTLNIVATRYLKIVISTGNDFCIRVELCGVDLSDSRFTLAGVGPRTAEVSLNFHSSAALDATTYFLISVKDKRGMERGPGNITREAFEKAKFYRLENLKPYTNYTLDIAPGNSYGVGGIWRESLETRQAAPETPPSNVKVVVRNTASVMVSWDPLPKDKWNGPSITYTVYQNDSVETKFDKLTANSLVLGNLKTATEYSFRVSASTTKESDRTDYITKITNQVAVEGIPEMYHSIKINLTKQDAKFKTAYVIVHSSKPALDFPDTFLIKDLSSAGSSSAYITARLNGDDLLKPFEVGADNWYNDTEPHVYNKPLKGKSKYRIFVRYVESAKIYFSTEWSKEILTFRRPTAPTEVVAKFLGDGSLEISWKSPELDSEAKLVEYRICYKQEGKKEKCETANGSPHTIPNLDPKARYEIRVLTDTSVGESEYAVQTINDDGGGDGQDGGGGAGGAIGLAIGIVVVVLIIVLAVVAFFLWRRRSRNRPSDRKAVDVDVKGDDETIGFHYDVDNNDGQAASNANVVSNDLIYSNERGLMLKQRHAPVPLSEFGHYVHEMKANKNEAFKKDYDELPNTSEASWDIAKKPMNKKKNRFANILTYDHSRVVLSGDEKHDYINASYIDGVGSNTYIASQGPTKLTKNDMWRMVWEQRAYSIVMVTSLVELGKPKCEKYWPDKGSQKYGEIEVTLKETKEFACHKTHTLRITRDDEEREVKHYYYSSWPDHGVPKYPTQLLAFRRHIRTHHLKQSGPILVHCSAGVGRTGVFLAIDSTLEKIEKGLIDSIDIFAQVSEMRTRRMNMIQTMEQYKFVHEAILETILCGINEVDSNNIKKEIEKQSDVQAGGMTGFQEKFKRLCDVSPTFFNEECEAGLLEGNQSKNRFRDIYPAESSRVNLSYVDGVEDSDYINAVFVHGYLGRNYFIATQSPLPNTVNEFWRMVHEKKSSTIVLLNNVKDETTFPQFWPSVRAKPEQYGKLTVQLESTTDEEGIVTRKLVLSQYLDLYEGQVVKIFQYTKWPDHGIPRTAYDVINLTSLVEKSRQSSGKGPVIVVCSNGAGRSGSYIAISNLIERTKIEQVVDVFQSIKIIRASRPQFVENAEQFKFCYSAVSAYIDSFSEYSNFE